MPKPLSHARIFALVRRIPRGRVATYGQIARILGHPRAARQIGYALHGCPDNVPWHRVINAKGRISLPMDSTAGIRQRRLLYNEGVGFLGGQVDLKRHGWDR